MCIKLLENPPQILKKIIIIHLFKITAKIFGANVKIPRGLRYSEMLHLYANFTNAQAGKIRSSKALKIIQKQLFQETKKIGSLLRIVLNIQTKQEAFRAIELMYKMIGVTMEIRNDGNFIVKRCFFSKYYVPSTCCLISYFDKGLIYGVTKGQRMRFHQKITDNLTCCRGTIGGI